MVPLTVILSLRDYVVTSTKYFILRVTSSDIQSAHHCTILLSYNNDKRHIVIVIQ